MFRTASRLPSSLLGLGLTAVLASPFALIGTVLAHRTVWTVVTTWTMQGWPTAPATLQHVELEAQGSNSRRTRATYSYLVDGRSFNGKTVTLYGADNLGSFQQRAYDELQGYLSRQAPYPVHFNPREPGESILMPVVRWEAVSFSLIFVVLFGGAGYGLLIGAYSGYRRLRIEAALVAQYPNEPWRHRIEWSTGRIQSDQNSAARGAVILAVMWNVCSWPMVFAVPEKLQAGEYGGLLLLLFPALGLGLVYWAIVSLARARRFGNTWLELDTFPARPGEHLRGRVFAPAALGEAAEVRLTICCEKNVKVSGDKGTTTRSETLWEQEASAPVVQGQSSSGDSLLKIDFPIPRDLPDSSQDRNEWFAWRLTALAELAGADFEAKFEVPVFKG
jgi:hypothetical protein